MFEVCARKEPYEGEDGNDVIAAIKDKNIKKRVTIPSHVSDKARSVVLDCMDENPEARATFDEIDTRLRRLDAKSLVPSLKIFARCFPPAYSQGDTGGRTRRE